MKDLECAVRVCGNGIAAIDLSGGIFASNMEELTELIETQQKSRTKELILNLTNLDFISSSGIGLFVQKNDEFKKSDKRLWIAGPNPDIAQIFDQFSLDEILSIVSNEQQAIEEIKQFAP